MFAAILAKFVDNFTKIHGIHQHLQRCAEIVKIREILAEKICMHGPFRHHHLSGSIPSKSSAQVMEWTPEKLEVIEGALKDGTEVGSYGEVST